MKGAVNVYDDSRVYVRTPERMAKGNLGLTLATHCMCGGFLAQTDRGRIFCVECEPTPAEVVHGGRLR